MPTALKKYINFTATVKEGKYGLHFQVIKLVTSYIKEKLQVLLNFIFFIGKEN